ncbi:MAG: acyltransferase [Bacteroidetes bacterium]|nr:acyltransferase [Bacteroidota bacterium]
MSGIRLHSLDYLRGLCAFGIMLYHFLPGSLEQYGSDNSIARLGVFGVSIFYILSGITLHHVYSNQLNFSKKSVVEYFTKRIFRIFPLLWTVTLLFLFLGSRSFEKDVIFLNFTGLFSIYKWDAAIATGAWSIGNELFFYSLFPVLLWTLTKSKPLFFSLLSLSFLLCIYYSFFVMNEQSTLWTQWRSYTNPLNQVFLFVGGIYLGHLLQNKIQKSNWILYALLFSITAFFIYPVSGDLIHLVTGTNRLVFYFLCFAICFCFYKLPVQVPNFLHQPLGKLGEMSYSVYLLHPIVYAALSHFYKEESNSFLFIFGAVVSTLSLSYLVYYFFEKKFIALGKSFS